MPIIDTWCEYSQSKAMPNVDESWSYEHRVDHQIKANDKPRYCKTCGHKLSKYNPALYCWNGSCQPKESKPKPKRQVVLNRNKKCQMPCCQNEITRGKYCVQCHDMICKRRRVWKNAYPNVPAPDGYIYRQRGANSRMEDYLEGVCTL